jgi:hypothetical protein
MSEGPVICFGQQPCGFFPRRFLYAKFVTARRVQRELGGGEIVFFFHDSDHDPRETQTIVHHRRTGEVATLNFAFANKVQRKWTPLYLKRVLPEWQATMARQLGAYVGPEQVERFKQVRARNVADFCLEMYRSMGLLEGIRVVRSSDPAVRCAARAVEDFFVDVPYQGEIVRARSTPTGLKLHDGGEHYLDVPPGPAAVGREQISPTRDTRLVWMQSVVRCTHYIAGAGEQAYLHPAEAPEITFLKRDPIELSDEAYTGES